MKILVVGSGKGSWDIRGLQLGNALGARIVTSPSAADLAWCDVAILVKRAGPIWAEAVRAAGVPFAWDVLDFWRQPLDDELPESAARQTLANMVTAYRPTVAIGATAAQAGACGPIGRYLPHHSWPVLDGPGDVRGEVQTVAYQGNPSYLGRWSRELTDVCRRRGWRFQINPPDLRTADIIVALRDRPWDGWMSRQWKSGVKLVNAIAAGRPILTQDTAAAREIAPPGTVLQSFEDLPEALQEWAPVHARNLAAARCQVLAPAYKLPAVAAQLRSILTEVTAPCSA